MNKNRLYLDVHAIQTVPPSCVNRDDTGRPKTAFYGGVNRARVSSQSWKHAIRNMFTEGMIDSEKLGYRTKYVVKLIAEALIEKGHDELNAEKKAVEALNNAGVKTNDKKGNITGALFFISKLQCEKLAELIMEGETEKKKYKEALSRYPSIDIALFGRMVADDADLNIDAACQVAHSISTHSIQNEYDYFTAVDDCSPTDNAGAGHLGTMEFNSSTLYRYATVNIEDLRKTLGLDSAEAAVRFVDAFIRSMPTGKQNSYANRTLPDMIYVTVRIDQPVNLCGAFERPVKGNDGFTEKSEMALFEYAQKVYEDYCGAPKYSFVVGHESTLNAEKVNFVELLEKLEKILSNEVI